MKIITTNFAERIFWQEEEREKTAVGCMNLVKPYPGCRRQQMKGFGGAFTEAAGYCYGRLPEEKQKAFLEAYFGEEGLNYNLGRTHINSCDFALENYDALMPEDINFGGNGTAGDDTADNTQAGSSTGALDMTRANRYVLPLIKDAMKVSRNAIEILLSPWSPPASMKTNGDMNHGGRLKPECRRDWARYIAEYIKALKAEGLKIQYLTVQNEPEAVQTWDSCVFHAREEMEFVRDYLYPALQAEGLSEIKILVWDHNKEIVFERAQEIFDDAQAASMIYGIAVHWYTGDHFTGLSLVKEKYPEKEIFFTEGCVEYSRFMDSDETAKAEMYAHDMIGNFNHGVSAFFDWNLLLDAQGGPNHVGNFCAAPVMASEDGQDFEKRLSYYYIGHFSRYVEKGAYVIPVTTYSTEVETCAFVNPSGTRVLVLLNRQDRELPVTVGEGGEGTELTLQPHTIVTVVYEGE
ncbi:MAG: glycoside hydrolase family 30 beta sandwich domain-containing protein [Lachnospiraceae bacterium]|nr:glycoside hydrolase family 30 beta sandwich domain-containing protein [Lachnospiraceae bacterium]